MITLHSMRSTVHEQREQKAVTDKWHPLLLGHNSQVQLNMLCSSQLRCATAAMTRSICTHTFKDQNNLGTALLMQARIKYKGHEV